jgi:hypothetical protein
MVRIDRSPRSDCQKAHDRSGRDLHVPIGGHRGQEHEAAAASNEQLASSVAADAPRIERPDACIDDRGLAPLSDRRQNHAQSVRPTRPKLGHGRRPNAHPCCEREEREVKRDGDRREPPTQRLLVHADTPAGSSDSALSCSVGSEYRVRAAEPRGASTHGGACRSSKTTSCTRSSHDRNGADLAVGVGVILLTDDFVHRLTRVTLGPECRVPKPMSP